MIFHVCGPSESRRGWGQVTQLCSSLTHLSSHLSLSLQNSLQPLSLLISSCSHPIAVSLIVQCLCVYTCVHIAFGCLQFAVGLSVVQ